MCSSVGLCNNIVCGCWVCWGVAAREREREREREVERAQKAVPSEWFAELAPIYYSLSPFKVKLSPKSNQGFISDWIWVKPLCKSITTRKDALWRPFRSFLSGQANFQWGAGALLRLHQNFEAHETLLVVSPGPLYMNTSIKCIVCEHRVS